VIEDTDTQTTIAPLLNDSDIDTINDARTILTRYAKQCGMASMQAQPSQPYGIADSGDYGSIHALAEVAEQALFTVLNWSTCHNVRHMTDDQLHNRV
jgi:hypothetical protein